MLETASKSKNEFLTSISNELVAKLSEKTDPKALLDEVLANNEIHLDVKIKFSKKGS